MQKSMSNSALKEGHALRLRASTQKPNMESTRALNINRVKFEANIPHLI
jgi:hypothetical protein